MLLDWTAVSVSHHTFVSNEEHRDRERLRGPGLMLPKNQGTVGGATPTNVSDPPLT